MFIKELKLKDFRNYEELNLTFSEGINVFYGENAKGKTNILESLYMFSSSKSHRGVKDKDLIRFGKDYASSSIRFFSRGREQTSKYEIFSNKNKKFFINDIEQKKLKALFGIFSTVIFSPEDLNLIKEGPEERRKFLNTDISQLRPDYFNCLKDYNKVIYMKNTLLKTENPDVNMLDVYNEKIAQLGAKITVHRLMFIEKLSELSSMALYYISDKKEKIELKYVPGFESSYEVSVKSIREAILNDLNKSKDEEIRKKVSIIGPHRDDVLFFLNGMECKLYCSQGQQRSVILSLKLAEFEFMKEVMGEPPILLLDDILSELDLKRQEKLLNFIRDNQTFITCTDKDLYNKIKYPVKAYEVK